jgi:hypothetical protein
LGSKQARQVAAMEWSNIAGAAAGITGVVGLLGFIVFAVLKLSSPAQLDLSTDIIINLKKHGIESNDIKDLTPARLREVLSRHKDISQDLISKVLAPQVEHRNRNVLIVSILLVILAAILGTIYLIVERNRSNNTNNTTLGNGNKEQIIVGQNSAPIVQNNNNFPPDALRALVEASVAA